MSVLEVMSCKPMDLYMEIRISNELPGKIDGKVYKDPILTEDNK